MSFYQQVSEAFERVGPVGDFLIVDAYPAERTWHVAVTDRSFVLAEVDETRDVLVLSAELGKPVDSNGFAGLALRFNHVWPAQGGARLSLDPKDAAHLTLDVGALDERRLAVLLRGFSGLADTWREIAAGRRAADTTETADILQIDQNFIRI